MKLIRTEEAKPGLKVARDVTDLRGNLLFKAGTPLDPALIDRCKERSVSHLFIEEADAAGVPAPDLAARKEALARAIDQSFAGTESSPVMAALREAAKKFHLSRIS